MLGAEMMLQNMLMNMLGMNTEQLKASVDNTINAIKQAAETMQRIEKRLDDIEAKLEGNTNATGSNGQRKLPSPHDNHIQL
jgi:cell division septum initiation protein DivIVA